MIVPRHDTGEGCQIQHEWQDWNAVPPPPPPTRPLIIQVHNCKCLSCSSASRLFVSPADISQDFVTDKLVTQLFGIVQRVNTNQPSNIISDKDGDRDVFPQLPGEESLKVTSANFSKKCHDLDRLSSEHISVISQFKISSFTWNRN